MSHDGFAERDEFYRAYLEFEPFGREGQTHVKTYGPYARKSDARKALQGAYRRLRMRANITTSEIQTTGKLSWRNA